MWFRRRERIISSLALAAMLAYALVPPGLLAACGCGSCESAAEVAGEGCCCVRVAHPGPLPRGEGAEKPAASCCQQACSTSLAGSSCACEATDTSQPVRIVGADKYFQDSSDNVPLPGALLPLAISDETAASRFASPLLFATPPPLRILLCVWRN